MTVMHTIPTWTRPATKLPNNPFEWTSTYQMCTFLQQEIRPLVRRRGGLQAFAKRAKLNPNTVSRLVHGETKEPRASTILACLKTLGIKITVGYE